MCLSIHFTEYFGTWESNCRSNFLSGLCLKLGDTGFLEHSECESTSLLCAYCTIKFTSYSKWFSLLPKHFFKAQMEDNPGLQSNNIFKAVFMASQRPGVWKRLDFGTPSIFSSKRMWQKKSVSFSVSSLQTLQICYYSNQC